MERHPLHDFAPIGLFLAVPLLLGIIQSQLPPTFYPWVQGLPQFAKCLIAPFVSYGWPFFASNLKAYAILAPALLLMAGKDGISTVSKQFLLALALVPLLTALLKTGLGMQSTGLGLSGVVFALLGIITVYFVGEVARHPSRKTRGILAGIALLVVVPLLVPPVTVLGDGRTFYTDVVGHWCGWLAGLGAGAIVPMEEARHPWIGALVLAYFAVAALPMVL
ncbi:membrane associated rhomboid family serine protease [Methanofollis sp. W23]|uniref:rhomboid family intramembrane serine protease n=1 Tax=Methanofollis sp. W23 TaxID=2817849 RepID=UPI001AEAE1EB|nr:rhomboid family intramembrane serine protease [Methanofollis sp. W23]MBP2147257.1 membrane associated rhomboid family serine protease [Methanofollis sp. W23]